MSKYVPYKDVAMLALSSMSVLNGEWQLAIQGLPTIDIVCCGECKYFWKCSDLPTKCVFHLSNVNADDFCSYGEREGK